MGSGKKAPAKGTGVPIAPAAGAVPGKVVRISQLPGGKFRVEVEDT